MAADPGQLDRWRAAVDHARSHPLHGQHLLDKTLFFYGERRLVKHGGLRKLPGMLLTLVTFGRLRLPAWQLTGPQPLHTLPLRLEHAFGGQCRIDAGSPAAGKVPEQHRLPAPEDTTDAALAPPVAHDACAANPAGHGFARHWYLEATGQTSLPVPQIEYPAHPFTVQGFERLLAGQDEDTGVPQVAGLGIRPKGHPERARLVGTIDAAFLQNETPLPQGFDFAVWNAAWPDQQLDALAGDEQIVLTNLCSPDTPGARTDAQGNTVLTLMLPGHLPFVLVRFENGAIGELAARLDTVLVDPDRRQLSCIWRATVAAEPAVRVLEARMLERREIEALRRAQDSTEQPPATHAAQLTAAQPEQRETHG